LENPVAVVFIDCEGCVASGYTLRAFRFEFDTHIEKRGGNTVNGWACGWISSARIGVDMIACFFVCFALTTVCTAARTMAVLAVTAKISAAFRAATLAATVGLIGVEAFPTSAARVVIDTSVLDTSVAILAVRAGIF